jgi:hypothetical protein
MAWTVYYDDIQEGVWFGGLHPELLGAPCEPITEAIKGSPKLAAVLKYDRPDVILALDGEPVLVLERTVEVPSGHNVGQRFARLAAAAEDRRPLVYFGPFVAFKHGGKTAGPRWMNLRLFQALDVLSQVHGTAVTTIRWPVDDRCEIVQDASKDSSLKRYLEMFFREIDRVGFEGINEAIVESEVQRELLAEREDFVATVKAAERYDRPPPSVSLVTGADAARRFGIEQLADHDELVIYEVGMRYIRSDPYTGSAMLYRYLYVLGHPELDRRLILHFPHVTDDMWEAAAAAARRKDVRLYRQVADGIIFSNGYRGRSVLVVDQGL